MAGVFLTTAKPPDPDPPVGPRVFVTPRGTRYHDSHKGQLVARWFDSPAAALAAGYTPCNICDPPGGVP